MQSAVSFTGTPPRVAALGGVFVCGPKCWPREKATPGAASVTSPVNIAIFTARAYNQSLTIDGRVKFCMAAKQHDIPTTADLIERVRALISKEKNGGKAISDYRLAKELHTSCSTIGRYRTGASTLDESMSLQVAQVLNLPPESVLACVALERSKRFENDAVTRAWEQVCQRVAVAAGPFFLGFLATLPYARDALSI